MSTEENSNANVCRPDVSLSLVTTLVRDLYGLHVQSCKELESYGDRNYHVTVDVSNVSNDFLAHVCEEGYVLKILNSEDSVNPNVVKAKNDIIQHVCNNDFPTPRLVPTTTGQLFVMCSLDKDKECYEVGGEKTKYAVRMLEFLPGTTLITVPLTSQLTFEVGQLIAQLDQILQNFDDSDCPDLSINWSMENVPCLRHLLYVIKDVNTRRVISDVINAFDEKVLQSEHRQTFRKGIIHSDLNQRNILVRPVTTAGRSSVPSSLSSDSSSSPREWNVCGILDFGDVTKSFLFLDLAIAMSYLLIRCPQDCQPEVFMGHVLAGYLSRLRLSKMEVELLPLAVCTRFCQTLVFGHHRVTQEPDNHHVMVYVMPSTQHLLRLWNTPHDVIIDLWKGVVASWGVEYPE